MTESMKNEAKNFKPLRSMLIVVAVIIATYLLTFLMPENVEDLGAWSLLPAFFLIVYIFCYQENTGISDFILCNVSHNVAAYRECGRRVQYDAYRGNDGC